MNNKGVQKDSSDWNEYKIYVLDYIKNLTESVERLDKKVNDVQLENVTKVYESKEEFQEQLKELAETILKLQIRVGLILTFLSLLVTLASNYVIRFIFNVVQ